MLFHVAQATFHFSARRESAVVSMIARKFAFIFLISYDFMVLTRCVILYVRGIIYSWKRNLVRGFVFCCHKKEEIWEQKNRKLTGEEELLYNGCGRNTEWGNSNSEWT